MNDSRSRLPVWGLVSLFLAAFVALSTELLPAGLLPTIASDLGVSDAQAGYFVAFYALASTIVPLPLALLFRRVSWRIPLVVALGVFVVANLTTALSDFFIVSLVARILGGAANGLCWAVLGGCVTQIVAPEKRGRALSIVFAGGAVAVAFGIPVSTALAGFVGWRAVFLAFAVIAAVLIPWAIRSFPRRTDVVYESKPIALRKLVFQKRFMAVLVVTMVYHVALGTVYTYIAPFTALAGFSAQSLSVLLSVFGIASVVGVWATGLITDRRLRDSLLGALGLLAMLMVFMGVLPMFPAVIIIGMAAWGIVYGGVPTLLQTALLRAVPARDSTVATAAIVTLYNGGIGVGSLCGGVILESLGAAALPLVSALVSVAALTIVFVTRGFAFTNRPPATQAL